MDYRQIVRQEAQAVGLDPNLAEATMFQESRGNPNAVSPAGARGLMQLMPGTAKDLGVDPADPMQNIKGGVRYLKDQIDKFGTAGGLAAYNAGPGRYGKTGGDYAALPLETQKYVPEIMNRAAKLAQGGSMPNAAKSSPSIDKIISALAKAQAANDVKATEEISGLLQSKFTLAKQKAEAAGDTKAVQEIDAQLQQFSTPRGTTNEMGTETVPVAPPTEPTVAPLPTEAAQVPQDQTQAAPDAPVAPLATQEQAQQGGQAQTPPSIRMAPKAGILPPSYKEEMQRQLDLTKRYALQGAEKAFTFPVRAVGEAGASLLSLAGAPEAGKAVSGAIGFNAPSVGAQAADIAGLPTPQTGLEKTVGAGAEALAGLGVGGVARSVATNAPKAAQELSSALFPTANTAAQAAMFGGLGSAMEAAPGTTTAGLAALVAAGAGKKAYQNVRTSGAESKILARAGGRPDLAKVDAEIITAIDKERNAFIRDAGKGAPPLGTAALNQTVAGKFVREAEDLVAKLPDTVANKAEILDKLRTGVNLSSEEVYALRSTKVGDMVADAIQKAQRVYSLTGVTPASGGAAGMAARGAVNLAPLAASAATGIPVVVPSGIIGGLKRMLGGGETRQQAGINITKPYDVKAAQKILTEQGPSISTQSMQKLDDYVSNSIKEATAVDNRQLAAQMGAKREELMAARKLAQEAATEAEKTAATKAMAAAEKEILDLGAPIVEGKQKVQAALAEQQAKDPTLMLSMSDPLNAPRTVKDQKEFARLLKKDIEKRMSPEDVKKGAIQKEMEKQVTDEISSKVGYPVGGANARIFKEFPHLRTPQYKVELESIANDQTVSETLRETAKQLLSNSKTDTGKTAFLGIQELVLSRLPAGGALSPQPGALSSVSPVRNPTSYNEVVRTAGEAANIARSSAPTPELGQFATSIAGLTKPSDKAKAFQERLAAATDQAEIDYLNKFVEPLTKFGKKGK